MVWPMSPKMTSISPSALRPLSNERPLMLKTKTSIGWRLSGRFCPGATSHQTSVRPRMLLPQPNEWRHMLKMMMWLSHAMRDVFCNLAMCMYI